MHSEYKLPGGKLTIVDLDVQDGRLVDVRVSGDFFLEPDSALDAINAALEGLHAHIEHAELTARIQQVLDAGVDYYGLSAEGVATCVRRALESTP